MFLDMLRIGKCKMPKIESVVFMNGIYNLQTL
jgi:hypothetical protein